MYYNMIAMIALVFLIISTSFASEYFGVLIDGEQNANDCPVLATPTMASITVDGNYVNLLFDTQASLELNCANITLSMSPFYRAKLLVNNGANSMKFDGILSAGLFSTVDPISNGSVIYPVMGSIVDLGSCLVSLESEYSNNSFNKLVTVAHSGEFRLCLKKADFLQ